MKNDTDTKKYIDAMESVTLSEAARKRIGDELSAYADFHPAKEVVRVGEESRSMKQVSQTSVWHTVIFTRIKRLSMPYFVIAAVLVLSGGTSLAAQGSVPGDTLYPVKIHVNESVRSAFAFSAESEARLQAELLAERVEEAEELKSEGRLEGALATTVAATVSTQAQKTETAQAKSNAETKAETDASIRIALSNFNGLVGATSTLAIGGATYADDSEMNTSSVMSTSLALETIPVSTLVAATEARVESLQTLIDRYEAELTAELYAEFAGKLETAAELLIQVKAQSAEEPARKLAYEAADLAGEVEATLSTLGTVSIDTETGAIAEIDFSTPPPSEPDRGETKPVLPSGAVIGGDAVIENNTSLQPQTGGGVDAALESTSGLSL